jgi:undecaprenyl-diphosphatase
MALYQHLHATSSSPRLLIAVAAILAEWPLVVAAGLTGWLLLRQRDRRGIVRWIAASGVAFLIEALVSMFAFHPRPFAAGFGPAWVAHAANNSMPSTHVTLALVMAIVLATRRHHLASAVVTAVAVVLAWARIYVGIHWPADMLGAILSAIVSVELVCSLEYGLNTCMRPRRKPAVAGHPQEPPTPSCAKHSHTSQPTER